MGERRNGARTFLDIMWHACRLSRIPGFRAGLHKILGDAAAEQIWTAWQDVCTLVDELVAFDNFYNEKDHTNDDGEGEDAAPLG